MKNLKDHPVVQFYIENNHFGEFLGMDFEVTHAGEVTYTMVVREEHLATPMAAHGGVVCSLMDATMGVCALTAVVLTGRVISTIEMKISFVAPASKGDQLTGVGEIVKQGKQLLFVSGKIHNQERKLIAIATGTFNAYPAEKAGFQQA